MVRRACRGGAAMSWVGPLALIVTEAALLNSSEVFDVLDEDDGGAKTFSVQLSPNGQANATHWGCYTLLRPDVENALRTMTTTQFKAFVDAKAAERGRVAPGNVTAFKNSLAMGVPGGNFWQFVTERGLKPVEVAI